MALYVGDSDNLVLMLGDTEVSAAYIGDTQVYPMSPFAVSPSRISLNNMQLTANLRIKSPEAWTITDTSGGWLSFSTNSGTAGVTVVTVTATTASSDRTATITVTTSNYSKTVAVSQIMFNMRYFHIHNVSNQTGTFTFTRNTSGITDLDWSTDSINWTAVPMVSNPTTTVPADGYLFFRGNNNWFCGMQLSMDVDHTFGGNVLSIADKTNFDSLTSVPSGGMNNFAMNNTHLVSAKDMDWGPACTNTGSGWILYNDFYGCTNLREAPDMSSFTTIGGAEVCHQMFANTAITQTPDLRNVTSVDNNGCTGMFAGCNNLTVAIAPSVINWYVDRFRNWLSGVSATGIVVINPNTINVPLNSTSGVPTGWTRVDSYYSVTLEAINGNAMDYATSDGRSGSVTAGYIETVRLDYPQTLSITTDGVKYHLYINGVDQGNGPSYTIDYLDLANGDTLTVVFDNEPS